MWKLRANPTSKMTKTMAILRKVTMTSSKMMMYFPIVLRSLMWRSRLIQARVMVTAPTCHWRQNGSKKKSWNAKMMARL